MEAQALMQQARELLASRNAPITPENLNRAMLMLTGSGDVRTEQTAEGFDMNAQVDRVLQRSTGRPGSRRPHQNETPRQEASEANSSAAEEAGETYALPRPPPDVAQAAQEAGQNTTIIPGEGVMYTAPNGPTSSLDGNGMNNRLLRDLVMGAESAGAVSSVMPQVGAGYFSRAGIPDIRLGLNRPQIAGPAGSAAQIGDDAAGAAVTATPRPVLPGNGGAQQALPASAVGRTTPTPPPSAAAAVPTAQRVAPTAEEIANLPTAMQRALAGPDLPPGTPSGLSQMQRASLLGPTPAGNAAATAARARAGNTPKPRNMSEAARQRRQNIAEQ